MADILNPKEPKISPEGIDAMIIQLRSGIKFMSGIPEYVKKSGEQFCEDLDKWSDELKKGGN